MSELPWENKKVADIMSSAGEEARISDGSSPDANNSSAPQIPDILANAFADVPMEEAKIEDSNIVPEAETSPAQEACTFPFGDLPDLSAIGAENKNESESNSDASPLPGILPPSMGNFDTPVAPENKEVVPPASMPIFDPDSPDIGGIKEVITSEQRVTKRSPPPIFDPSLLDDGPQLPEMAPSMLIPENSPMSSQPNELSTAVPSEGSNPFDTPSSDSSPSAGVNPFESPFPDASPSVGVNPFDTPSPDAPPSVGVNPFESPSPAVSPSAGVNPFESPSPAVSPSAGVNPFETPSPDASISAGVNPFEDQSPAANPFESTGPGANPFAQSTPTVGQDTGKTLPDIGVPKVNVNVDSLKRNIEGISTIAKGLFKNLTKGKSLIERMDDMRVDPSSDMPGLDGEATPVSSSPFESDSPSPFESPSFNDSPAGVNPFESSVSDVAPSVNGPSSGSVNPFESPVKQEDSIREVIPVEKPAEEMENADPFESPAGPEINDDLFDEPERSLPDSDIMDIIPVENNLAPETGDELVDASEEISSEVPAIIGESILLSEDISSGVTEELTEQSSLYSELRDMKKSSDEKFNSLETDVGEFKDTLTNVDAHFSSIQEEVQAFSSRISELDTAFSSFVKSNEGVISDKDSRFGEVEGKLSSVEIKIGDFESNLSVLQSDNVSIKSGLSKVEDSVSELVESYTALLVQLHESFQENESNFARIDMISEKLDEIGSKISSIEKVQEGSRETSMEFSRSISSILDNLGNTSSAFSEFKQESEHKDADMLEKIDSVTGYVETELKKLGARSHKGFGQNVHLSNILKNSSNMKLCMEWLEFLMELVGRNNLPDILSYYEELGWITEQIRIELLHYADGIDFYMEKPDWKLTPDDHVKSIWFIESLAGMKVDKNRLSVIERDIERVKKGTEIYGI